MNVTNKINIPIFVIVHNQYEILKKSVDSYRNNINYPIEIVYHDVASVYYETLDYLKKEEQNGCKVYRSEVNNHHTVKDSIKDYLGKHPECKYVIMTDPDIELYNINSDILDIYIHALHKLNKITVGPMLKIDDIPDGYYNKACAVSGHSSQFWNKPKKNIVFNKTTYKYIECNTDTTFQIFLANNMPETFPHKNSIRFLEPYSAQHLDWYLCPNNITPCKLFCYFTSSGISHWNNSDWRGKYYNNQTIKCLADKIKPKYNYIYYNNKCRCRNNYNFGNFILEFIYERLFNKKPILNINGGKDKKDVIIGSGSVLNVAKNNSIIWGTGFMFGTEKIVKPKNILSVRGPLTRDRLLELGLDCPETYGDIGLILPYFYYPQVKKKYKIGIIPHYVDYDKFIKIYRNIDKNIYIINVTDPIEKVIKNILECEMTMSSSLEGIITSHAYNIKCAWIKISDKIGGGHFKFRDYYGSININYTDGYKNLLPIDIIKQIPIDEIIKFIDNYPNPKFPMNTKSIIKLCPFINIK